MRSLRYPLIVLTLFSIFVLLLQMDAPGYRRAPPAHWVERSISSHIMPLDDSGAGWLDVGAATDAVILEPGLDFDALPSRKISADSGPRRLSRTVSIPDEWVRDGMHLALSAWVWSDQAVSARLELHSPLTDHGKVMLSAPHSGQGRWEHLTVSTPYSVLINSGTVQGVEKLTITLSVQAGVAHFADIKTLVMIDPRFKNFGYAESTRFGVQMNYRKGHRLRIAIVGASNVQGAGAAMNASFPFLLQLKLETLYPGVFEVMNYALGNMRIMNLITSLDSHFSKPFDRNSTITPDDVFSIEPVFFDGDSEELRQKHLENAVSLKDLDPDLIIFGNAWIDMNVDFFEPEFYKKVKRVYLPLFVESDANLTLDYYRTLLDLIDGPTRYNYMKFKRAEHDVNVRGEQLEKPLLAHMASPGWDRSKRFPELAAAGGRLYAFLADAFVSRALRKHDVWLVDWPYFGRNRTHKLVERYYDFYFGNNPKQDIILNANLHGFIQDAQWQALTTISERRQVPFVALSRTFEQQVEQLSLRDYVGLKYFYDQVHYTARGNAWLVDAFFLAMRDRFDALANARVVNSASSDVALQDAL